ncbi:Sec-independent protein translocase subunit TatA/TatB [Mucilaginibacter paludis]|uniref:Sec-independent translocation protein mttA/Hcf106 n=1 Tax=Mucilaginibacter paludis DSM 18603 TaxID=714943 RepID=H1Y513_9SPHI|nr:twin-arginine translocase TatA/TatE family subunit [Mucilaginibacter paludis]EHQ28341.1 sec-independent translocation protein mttA/Hcf106 [Mucilaginibacter paludis DSM 18603]
MLSSIFLFFSFSASEIMFILFVALILFGGDKFPEIARGLGKGIREFKDLSDGVKREIHSQINSYEANPNRDNEIKSETPAIAPVEQPRQLVADTHEAAIEAPAPMAEQPAHEQAITEAKVTPPKPDFTPPANTISHQSY